MTDSEALEWLKLLQAGGNAGIIVLVLIAIKVANAFLAELRKLNRGQEAIRLAIVARDPKAAETFRAHDAAEANAPPG